VDLRKMEKGKEILKDDPVWEERFKKINAMTGLEITPDTIEELASSIGKNIVISNAAMPK